MAKKRYAVLKALLACTAILVSLIAAVAVTAQGLPEGIALMIAQARKANADLMRQYTWHSRTELIMSGQVKDTRIDLVNYGPDGKLKRTPLNDQSAPLPRGFLRKAAAEDEKKKTEEYLAGLRALLDQYTLSTSGKVLDFMEQAKIAGPDSQGLIHFTGNGVVVPGDSMTVSADMASRQTRRITVNTFFQGDAVELTATFKTLAAGGLVYTAFAEVTVPAKQMNLQVQNFDYQRSN
jgi:hypothetical protein